MPDGTTDQAERPVPVQAPFVAHREASSANGGLPQPVAQATENTSPSPNHPDTKAANLSQLEFLAGGKSEVKADILESNRKEAADKLRNRLRTVNVLQAKGEQLSQIEKLLASSNVIENLESGNYTREDLAVVWIALQDEMRQKSLAQNVKVRETIGTKTETRKGIGIGRIRIGEKSVDTPTTKTEIETSAFKMSTAYTRELGFDTWHPERVTQDLQSLSRLMLNFELDLFGKTIPDLTSNASLADLLTSLSPQLDRKTGNILHDAVVDELGRNKSILEIYQIHGVHNFLELSEIDQSAAAQVEDKARTAALDQFAGELGKKLLSEEKPDVDTAAIKTYAERFRKPVSPENIKNLQENAATADKLLTEEQSRLDVLKTEKTNKENALEQLELTSLIARRTLDQNEPRLQQDIDAYKAELNTYAAGSEDYNRVNTRLQASINELKQLVDELSRAEATFTQTKNRVQTLPNLITQQENTLKEKVTAKNQADNDLKQTQESFLDEDKATAQAKWMGVLEKYSTIIDQRFSQKYGDEFTREKLADSKERPDGQTEGAERIREHIFRLVLANKADYDPELARKMLSDEAIARTIIWNYKIDTAIKLDMGTPHEATVSSLLTHLQDNRDIIREIEAMKPSERRDSEREDLKKFKDTEKRLLKTTLPYLNSSQFQVGDLLRFMIHEGLKSAERGNPYLSLSEYYESPKPELRLEAESIYKEGLGEIKEMKDSSIRWEGRIVSPMAPPTFSRNAPVYYSVGLGNDRNLVNYSVYAKTDRDFLELLPDTLDASFPDEIKLFYDRSGKLSTDKPGLPGQVKLYEGTAVTTDDTLNSLDGMISGEFSQIMTSSIADYFLKKSQQERLQMLRGFHTVENINDVALAEHPTDLHNYQIRLDNSGNFFIQDITNPALPEEHELSSFFQRRLEDFKGSKLTLNADERKTLQEEFLKILSPLGKEILRAQQRR